MRAQQEMRPIFPVRRGQERHIMKEVLSAEELTECTYCKKHVVSLTKSSYKKCRFSDAIKRNKKRLLCNILPYSRRKEMRMF
jgi:hypothetical protein